MPGSKGTIGAEEVGHCFGSRHTWTAGVLEHRTAPARAFEDERRAIRSAAAAGLLRSLLFGLEPWDPLAFAVPPG